MQTFRRVASLGALFACALLFLSGLAAAQVTVTAPSSGQTVSGTTQVTVQLLPPAGWADIYIDGYPIASTPPLTTTWDTTLELNGTHFVEAVAFNSSGRIGSNEVRVMVANSTPTATPTPAGYFGTLRPHAKLPSANTCATEVLSQPSSEGIPANVGANHTMPDPSDLKKFHARPVWSNKIRKRDFAKVDGDFTGTTDQIIQWASCKWGVDENAMRAESWYETFWIQSTAGDKRTDYAECHTPNWNGWDGTECWQSYGIFQTKVLDFNVWPETRDSTAFNSDFRGAYLRACLNGDVAYLTRSTPEPGYPKVRKANLDYKFWGCLGQWASGGWYDVGSIEYITSVRRTALAARWPGGH